MHIKRLFAEDFKRFTKLEIVEVPATAKLVLLAGPNGNGKSSLFDLMMRYYERHVGGIGWDSFYHAKIADPKIIPPPDRIDVEFHEAELPADRRKMFYFRSAYRNDPQFAMQTINRPQPALQERRFHKLIENDSTVGSNFQRLYAQTLEDAFEDDENISLKQFREKILGDIKSSLELVMPELTLESLGNPFKVQTFRFSKGTAKNFNYMNLSGGEKSAFDLLLDYTVKKREFDDTIFCIDEPEAHLNPRVHGKMLEAPMNLTEGRNQLWIATEHERRGFRVLRRRQIESYLFDDEVLRLLCASVNKADKEGELLEAKMKAIDAAKSQGHRPDDIKRLPDGSRTLAVEF
jgi:predicted ATPase